MVSFSSVFRYFFVLIASVASVSAAGSRSVVSFNDGWQFRRADSEAWSHVNLPHTWNADAYVEKDFYRGKAYYRKTFGISAADMAMQHYLRLEGASKYVDVFLNGEKVGSHAGGYTAVNFDLTPFLRSDSSNVLEIMADNSRQDVTPISGDFTFFGGMYRDVWLISTPQLHFDMADMGSSGVKVAVPEVNAHRGVVTVSARVANDGKAVKASVINRLFAPDGVAVQSVEAKFKLGGGETAAVKSTFKPVVNPQLWSPDSPQLYSLETLLVSEKGDTLDRVVSPVGFRWFSFDADNGFSLNGTPLKLRGVCRHQDMKPYGPALSDESHRRDIRMIKEMGANYIRISHYPQDEAILEMCDREGLLVWEEIPIIDHVPDTPGYAENCERNLREMIRQHYNHPSVIMWGYMNEIMLLTSRYYTTPESYDAAIARTIALASRLESVVKEEDPLRCSTMAFHGSDIYNETGISDITDVVGWNLYQGWYVGKLNDFEEYLADQHMRYPSHPILVSEYGAGSDMRLHSLTPRPFDFSAEYQQTYLEHYVPVIESTPYIAGGSHWNLIDFCAANRDESTPRINNKGIVQTDRRAKDVYYYFKAMWRKDIPVVHIAACDWPVRTVVSDVNRVVMPVKVYTNFDSVSVSVNGVSLGAKPVENCFAVFDVPLTEGDNVLTAGNGDSICDVASVCVNTVPDHIDVDNLGTKEIAVNVGSNCWYVAPESGLCWLPDREYVPGGWGYIGGELHSTTTEIHGTTDNPLFQTMRRGIDAYRFDLPDGNYEVELCFANTGVSSFSVTANGVLLEQCLAPASSSGSFFAVRKKYEVSVDGGCLTIRFTPISGETNLNAIKLRRI